MPDNFETLFQIRKPIIGMIHLSGNTPSDKVKRALEELTVYQEEGVDGAIIEDYHGSVDDVYGTLKESSTRGFKIVRGVNLLRNPYSSFRLASEFGAKFIQFDSVQTPNLNLGLYNQLRVEYPTIAVLGGVGFKYTKPIENTLETDLKEGREKCEAIVTTGSGTGIETPIEKLREFKRLLGDFPLIVGAGVDLRNVSEQLRNTDGAVIGSYFKPDRYTYLPVDRNRVRNLMKIVKEVRSI
ncbi:MAG: BtpA/SgcQ family protein [Nanoarchaeota archaeon]|nr:BtpA/SgcQ family protein [Nanoarchaeota archaeon]